LHHWQERSAFLPMVRVSAALRAAETRLMRKVQERGNFTLSKGEI